MQRSITRLALLALVAIAAAAYVAIPASAAEEGASCATNTGIAKISPGIGETAQVQNITVKGTLGECTGSAGSKAPYVVHLKTSKAITCASLAAEGAVAEGSSILKWGKGHGNSLGSVTVSGSPGTGFSLTGSISEGPYAGGSVSTTLSGTPVFTGKGEPCSKKNRLKELEVAGTSPFVIS